MLPPRSCVEAPTMAIQMIPRSDNYTINVDARERDQLLTAVEFSRAMLLGHHDGARMLLDLDADRLDALADRLFLVGRGARQRDRRAGAVRPARLGASHSVT